ncbi:fluoride efflux transporter CrcB [Nitrosococcus wardiae]|uniref:Fluoride-specific ion channel FluC n=2 Tax=Nitrosococcus wardiae TaxID=1814290 RepID=A0A4P7C1N7_9GAMM|nr:fluoride efflux transporter CrcB [Nitrosococcus wardiae]
MGNLFAIALGGSIGAVSRYLVATGIYAWLGQAFPHGTLFVNVSGSFLMGFLNEFMLHRISLDAEYRAAILVGFLGAYTTFSTFALETLYLFEEGNLSKAALNILLSIILCLAAVWIGLVLGRQIFAADLYPWLGYGFPYGGLALVPLVAFALATVAGFFFHYFDLPAVDRVLILISLLGVITLAATLGLTLLLPEIRLEFQSLLSIFAVNALLGVAAVWLGTLMGNWLWRISKLP